MRGRRLAVGFTGDAFLYRIDLEGPVPPVQLQAIGRSEGEDPAGAFQAGDRVQVLVIWPGAHTQLFRP